MRRETFEGFPGKVSPAHCYFRFVSYWTMFFLRRRVKWTSLLQMAMSFCCLPQMYSLLPADSRERVLKQKRCVGLYS